MIKLVIVWIPECYQNAERALDQAGPSGALNAVGGGKMGAPSDMLMKLARTTPYYKRNRPHICSFWVKGEQILWTTNDGFPN